jgi:hypothetical protein
MKNLSQNSWSPGQNLNPGSSEYETRLLTTQPQHLVIRKDNIKMGHGETGIEDLD